LAANKPRVDARAASRRAAIVRFVLRSKGSAKFVRQAPKTKVQPRGGIGKLAHGTGVFPTKKRNFTTEVTEDTEKESKEGLDSAPVYAVYSE